MSGQIHRITEATLHKLRDEWHHLTTVGRTEIARVIEAARSLGDLSENGDYHAAKDEQGKMEARIHILEDIIHNHEIIERDENSDIVQHGSIVTVVFEGDSDDEASDYFVGSIEEKPADVITASPTSPMGEALLGKKLGESVTYAAPSGDLTLRIIGLR